MMYRLTVFPVYTYLFVLVLGQLLSIWGQKSVVQSLYTTQTSIWFAWQTFRRWLKLLSILRRWFCSLLFNVPLIDFGGSVFGPCCVMHYFVSIIQMSTRAPVAFLYLPPWCLMTVSILWLFRVVLRISLQCVIEVFPDHTHFLWFNHFIVNLYIQIKHIALVWHCGEGTWYYFFWSRLQSIGALQFKTPLSCV